VSVCVVLWWCVVCVCVCVCVCVSMCVSICVFIVHVVFVHHAIHTHTHTHTTEPTLYIHAHTLTHTHTHKHTHTHTTHRTQRPSPWQCNMSKNKNCHFCEHAPKRAAYFACLTPRCDQTFCETCLSRHLGIPTNFQVPCVCVCVCVRVCMCVCHVVCACVFRLLKFVKGFPSSVPNVDRTCT